MRGEKEYPIAKIVGFTDHCIKIYCPYCGMIHMHGREGGPGHVSSHCLDRTPDDVGYFIPQFDTYDPIVAVELEKLAEINKRKLRRSRGR